MTCLCALRSKESILFLGRMMKNVQGNAAIFQFFGPDFQNLPDFLVIKGTMFNKSIGPMKGGSCILRSPGEDLEIWSHFEQRAAMPCHAMPCHAMPCHVMPISVLNGFEAAASGSCPAIKREQSTQHAQLLGN
eukprot:s923_g18.t1